MAQSLSIGRRSERFVRSFDSVYIPFYAFVTNGICPMLITRTWLATDACTNTATCSQTVTVVNTTPPIIRVRMQHTHALTHTHITMVSMVYLSAHGTRPSPIQTQLHQTQEYLQQETKTRQECETQRNKLDRAMHELLDLNGALVSKVTALENGGKKVKKVCVCVCMYVYLGLTAIPVLCVLSPVPHSVRSFDLLAWLSVCM